MPRSGDNIGPYRVERELGRGGMGVVFLSRDTRLDRAVALKALPEGVASDPDGLARFEREAKTLASLSHPNIATIYGVEESGGARYIALEFIEGETLADRLARGPIPPADLIPIALQIATGMEAAHEAGIVHRDLKPGNVMITPDDRVKILDFGLAKAPVADGRTASGNLVNSPTLTHSPTTIPGVILGTAAYLSPEQARGKPVDRRTDIWAFGCILYECLTGKAPFTGETVSDLIARILEREPDWSALPAATPPRLRALMERCLRKDARERLRDIGDARVELTEIEAGRGEVAGGLAGAPAAAARPARPGSRFATIAWPALALFVGAGLVLAALRLFAGHGASEPVRRFAIPVPQLSAQFNYPPRISPDGRYLLYTSAGKLMVRDLESFTPSVVNGTDGAWGPFWSCDSRHIGYYKDGKIWASDLAGSQVSPVCGLPSGLDMNNADWGRDGNIVYAQYMGGLYVVPATGGEPKLLVAPESTEVDFHHPQFLPDGRHLVAVAHQKQGAAIVVAVSYPDGKRKDLGSFDGVITARYSPTGHLLLTLDDQEEVRAVPFSASKVAITGKPFLALAGGLYPTIGADGTLVYCLGPGRAPRELVWVDRQGRTERVPGPAQLGLDGPALSPDGRRVAVTSSESGGQDIWLLDPARGARSRLVSTPVPEQTPVWSPRGDRILYLRWSSAYLPDIMSVSADGRGTPALLAQGFEPAMSPDDRYLVFQRTVPPLGSALFVLDLASGGSPVRLTPNALAQEGGAAISPDGRWIAYASDEPGENEIYVRRFPDGTEKRQISLHGGAWPFWKPGGGSLYYWEKGTLMEVPVGPGGASGFGAPRALFRAADAGVELQMEFRPPACAATADGRFLMVRRVPDDPMNGILVVQHWTEEFAKRH
ncbi:MAG: protein kinase domain-containing protein [Hyphomicrobiales bacterium]